MLAPASAWLRIFVAAGPGLDRRSVTGSGTPALLIVVLTGAPHPAELERRLVGLRENGMIMTVITRLMSVPGATTSPALRQGGAAGHGAAGLLGPLESTAPHGARTMTYAQPWGRRDAGRPSSATPVMSAGVSVTRGPYDKPRCRSRPVRRLRTRFPAVAACRKQGSGPSGRVPANRSILTGPYTATVAQASRQWRCLSTGSTACRVPEPAQSI
jgi:hypothetical protein